MISWDEVVIVTPRFSPLLRAHCPRPDRRTPTARELSAAEAARARGGGVGPRAARSSARGVASIRPGPSGRRQSVEPDCAQALDKLLPAATATSKSSDLHARAWRPTHTDVENIRPARYAEKSPREMSCRSMSDWPPLESFTLARPFPLIGSVCERWTGARVLQYRKHY